jgi:hypothetical protein
MKAWGNFVSLTQYLSATKLFVDTLHSNKLSCPSYDGKNINIDICWRKVEIGLMKSPITTQPTQQTNLQTNQQMVQHKFLLNNKAAIKIDLIAICPSQR